MRRRLTFDVKVPAGDIKRLTVSLAGAQGRQAHPVPGDLLQDLIPRAHARSASRSGRLAGFDVPGLLASLDRYPYGCAEQTTSRALPLLYVNDVAKRIGLANDARSASASTGPSRACSRCRTASGAFGIWGPSDGDMWLTSYVTDFLTRAKEAGYAVRQQPFTQALDRLQNFISYAQDFEKGGEAAPTRSTCSARNGRAPIGELRYYVDTKLDGFCHAAGPGPAGAALAMLGDQPRAERRHGSRPQGRCDAQGRRRTPPRLRHRHARRAAALITLASETGVAKADVPRLIDVVAKAYGTKTYTSTQEQAWMLLAARALGDEAKSMTLTVNGQPHQGQLIRGLTAGGAEGRRHRSSTTER